MAKGHIYHHKADESGCVKRGCMTVLCVVIIVLAIRGCFAVVESFGPERQPAAPAGR